LKNWNQSALVSASRESSAQDEGLFPHVRWSEGVAGVCPCMKLRSRCGDLSRFVTGERTPSSRNLEPINCPYASESTKPRLIGPDNVRRENSWAKLPCCLSRGPSRAVRVLTLRLQLASVGLGAFGTACHRRTPGEPSQKCGNEQILKHGKCPYGMGKQSGRLNAHTVWANSQGD
jgi:hypothetical protein